MPKQHQFPVIELDGATGEGGGQLLRMAVALAAVLTQPVRIRNIRANRRPRGGLKSQHVTGIRWLADATAADTVGLEVGSRELLFVPRRPPAALAQRRAVVWCESSAASALLIIQAILPLALFSGSGLESELRPIELEVSGGTNVSFSPSYEYLDQVFLPVLEDLFGVRAERKLQRRGWSTGPEDSQRGSIWLRLHPVPVGRTLQPRGAAAVLAPRGDAQDTEVCRIDASVVAPARMHQELSATVELDLAMLFPGVSVSFPMMEDSGHDARLYILVVAFSRSGLRWGCDVLHSISKKKPASSFAALSRRLCRDLHGQVTTGHVDEHLQDQLVCFQALAEGRTEVRCGSSSAADQQSDAGLDDAMQRLRLDRAGELPGTGTLHCRTARWVAAEMLPAVKFYNGGQICEGIGFRAH